MCAHSQALTDSIDMTKSHERLRGFVGGFAVGDYAYFVPHFDGRNPGHIVARVDAVDFREDGVEHLDLWEYDQTLAGFFSGFGYTTTGPARGRTPERFHRMERSHVAETHMAA